MNYELLVNLAESYEMQDEALQRIINLQILLGVKERLGDLVDITDRLFGYTLYCEGNTPFVFSTISVIFSLPEELEMRIGEGYYSAEEWEEDGNLPPKNSEEVYAVYIPFEYSKEEMEAAVAQLSLEEIEYVHIMIKNDCLIFYFDGDYYPFETEKILEICVQLRLILEGGEAIA